MNIANRLWLSIFGNSLRSALGISGFGLRWLRDFKVLGLAAVAFKGFFQDFLPDAVALMGSLSPKLFRLLGSG